MTQAPRSKRPKRLLLPALVVVGLAFVGWRLLRRAEPAPTAEPGEPGATAPAETAAPPSSAPQVAALEVPAPAPPPAALDAGADGPQHPHPITPQHERIFRENALLGQLNGAMDVKDGAGVRRLLEQYREEFPDDPNQLQEGYRIIADCLEHPGPAARAAGQRYYDQERGSILRRMVDRHCLGP